MVLTYRGAKNSGCVLYRFASHRGDEYDDDDDEIAYFSVR